MSAGKTPAAGAPVRAAAPAAGAASRPSRSWRWLAVGAATGIVLLAGLALFLLGDKRSDPAAAAAFVGSAACAGCHAAEADAVARLAPRPRDAGGHRGRPCSATSTTRPSTTATWSRASSARDGQFLVETDGPDGKLADFEVRYTFGVDPLQQYLIALPDGRLQALAIAWDARPAAKGGQRWFHLYPDESVRRRRRCTGPGATRPGTSCAPSATRPGCARTTTPRPTATPPPGPRSTSAARRATVPARRTSPGRRAAALVAVGKRGDPEMGLLAASTSARTSPGRTTRPPATAAAQPRPAGGATEIETCGMCHGRRGQIAESWRARAGRSLDTHLPACSAAVCIEADGQMVDEVYNYGSFRQSRMFAAGVTCSDCHEPHARKLRAAGDGVCCQCHAPDKYARGRAPPSRARRPAADAARLPHAGAHLHGGRPAPRPRLPRAAARSLGALRHLERCNDCHADQDADWAAAAIERWHGPERKGFQTYAGAFHAAWNGGAEAARLLGDIAADRKVPAIARASALAELAPYLSPANLELARVGLADPDPMVRIGAIEMLDGAPANRLWPLVSPLLSIQFLKQPSLHHLHESSFITYSRYAKGNIRESS